MYSTANKKETMYIRSCKNQKEILSRREQRAHRSHFLDSLSLVTTFKPVSADFESILPDK